MKYRILKDRLGNAYEVLEGPTGLKKKLIRFDDIESSRRFVRQLNLQPESLQMLSSIMCHDTAPYMAEANPHLENLSKLLWRGQLRVAAISGGSHFASGAQTNSVKAKDGGAYEFLPIFSLVGDAPSNTRTFSNPADAEEFIRNLSLSDQEIVSLGIKLEVPSVQSVQPQQNAARISKDIAKSLADGDVLVVAKKTTPKAGSSGEFKEELESVVESIPGNRKANLGPETEKVVCGVCKAKNLIVSCAHGRKVSPGNILQIVPDSDKVTKVEYEMFGVKVTLNKKFGGNETINSQMELEGNKLNSCFTLINPSGETVKQPQGKEKYSFNQELNKKWLVDQPPEILEIKASGCTGSALSTTVEVFPSDTYEVKGEISLFKDWVKEVNEAWESWGKSIFNLSPVELKPSIKGPSGTFGGSWGWKEDSDERVYYDVNLEFGLNPILGVGIELKVSFAKIGLAAAGVPPVISDFAANHLLDIFLKLGAGCQANLLGSPHHKFYTDGSKSVDGEAKFSLEGEILLGLAARVGSDFVVSCQVEGEGKCKAVGEDVVAIDRTGVSLQTTVKLEPFVGTVKLTTKMFKIRSKTNEKEWKPWGAIELYKSKPKKLLS